MSQNQTSRDYKNCNALQVMILSAALFFIAVKMLCLSDKIYGLFQSVIYGFNQ